VTSAGNSLLDRLAEVEERGLAAIREATSEPELEAARIEYLGRSGAVADAFGQMGQVEAELRPQVGRSANAVKRALTAALEARQTEISEGVREDATSGQDLSLPGRARWRGGVHPVTRVIDEICDIFRELGFTRVRGPEVETTWYNFTALNISLDHPAVDEMDTFYLSDGALLRTHTSPVQARIMEKYEPPVRVVAPGLAFRRDSFDPSHAPNFDQIEGLAVDEGIDFVEFRAAIEYFVRRFFGEGTESRFRPSFYPFTEPSAEVDVTCSNCAGSGCATCKRTGWITIMGAGMVDPAAFEAVGYDPERYTGYAFGMGPGRIAMVRHNIPDIRLLYEGDVRFLEQFA
jgi:phenylalanyl-tRNA synthetase alpha chain